MAADEIAKRFPPNVCRLVLAAGAIHQLLLLLLSVAVFLMEVVPLELQRRIVNDIVKHRAYGAVVLLCATYAVAVVVHGGTKLVLNVYRGWVGERVTRELRRRIRDLVGSIDGRASVPEAEGLGVSMIVGEVEPIGGFVGGSVSEPILQAGVLASVVAYMTHVEPAMAAAALLLFVPQLIFVPMMQGAINRRSAARIWMLRRLSIKLVAHTSFADPGGGKEPSLIDRIFMLNMDIFRLKFSMNFLMNLCNHLQVVTALLLGGWFVLTDQLEIGGVVAVISGIGRLNDPWGDLVNYFRDATATQVKLRLLDDAMRQLSESPTTDRDAAQMPVATS